MQRSSVLLPLPLGPMITSTSPPSTLEVDVVEHEVVAEALADCLGANNRPGAGGARQEIADYLRARA